MFTPHFSHQRLRIAEMSRLRTMSIRYGVEGNADRGRFALNV
jgi:hypothetical protein